MHNNTSHVNTISFLCVFASRFASFTQVTGFIQKISPHPSHNDSLEGEIQAFLTDEDQLHTYDDLTKVNPVTPTTGNKWGYNVTGASRVSKSLDAVNMMSHGACAGSVGCFS